jgi:DNA-binding transcriptional regulator YhcF (GntR family)
MFDQIDPRSSTPLYAQIAGRLKVAIAAGELRPGEGLQSVRQLAGRLRINPATVVQAYRELESEGFVETRHGAGTYVRDVVPERRDRERATEASRLVRSMMTEAARTGLTLKDLKAAIDREIEGRNR